MPSGLCNVLATFQGCMISIFSNMIEKFIEIFMDDFSTFGYSFDNFLSNMSLVLQRCKETNLVLNWKNVTSWWRKEQFLATGSHLKELKLIESRLRWLTNFYHKPTWKAWEAFYATLSSIVDLFRIFLQSLSIFAIF